jgi:serine/threonine-protein kinase
MSVPGTIGRYQILGELGRGAMGVVYRGRDPQLERAVAIKLIRLEETLSTVELQELEARFLREARVAARIMHPGVATVHDAGSEPHGFYLVMELVEGESLARTLQRGEFPGVRVALELVAQVADALGAAHAAGVVHRDVKPANILILPDGRVKVTDFGVAKAVGESTELTRSGTVLGSPAYMAPEQIQGQAIDGRADLFSLGVILYELLLRRRPFPADTVTTLIYQILHQDPFTDEQVLRALGPELGAFLRAALAKLPAERIPDAAAFAARARALAGKTLVVAQAETAATRILAAAEAPTVQRPASVAPPPPAAPPPAVTVPVRAPGSPLLIVLGVVGVLLAALATGAFLLLRRPPPPPSALPSPQAVVDVPSEPLGAKPPAVEPAAPPSTSPASPPIGQVIEVPVQPVPPPVATAPPLGAVAAAPPPASLAPAAAGSAAATTAEPPVSEPSPAPLAAAPEPAATAPATPSPPLAEPIEIAETYESQGSVEFDLDPEKTEIWIGGERIGTSEELDGEPYAFPGPGIYDVRLQREGFHTAWIRIVIHSAAEDEIAEVDTELRRVRRRRRP